MFQLNLFGITQQSNVNCPVKTNEFYFTMIFKIKRCYKQRVIVIANVPEPCINIKSLESKLFYY